jgi:hypothetical protein
VSNFSHIHKYSVVVTCLSIRTLNFEIMLQYTDALESRKARILLHLLIPHLPHILHVYKPNPPTTLLSFVPLDIQALRVIPHIYDFYSFFYTHFTSLYSFIRKDKSCLNINSILFFRFLLKFIKKSCYVCKICKS